MIERLRRALEHIEEVPEEVQDELATEIELYTDIPGDQLQQALAVIGAWRDLPDDMEETLLRWRRESPPSPPMDEQLSWLDSE